MRQIRAVCGRGAAPSTTYWLRALWEWISNQPLAVSGRPLRSERTGFPARTDVVAALGRVKTRPPWNPSERPGVVLCMESINRTHGVKLQSALPISCAVRTA
ncbi:hypothetical protein GCM10010326_78790 [Streptomyces xanthochromogenes]|uniref:Transposase n=1 Tax=Streptomyces xanthochromogenes TaxID=67384 RepID=A0ABQ3B311_9ACTN|nr:hypothetical protein GCM10010326_78790 [Streptomyces xanthochromogenes]